MDQGQCPVFEFIPKWPDLGDTLFKKKTKIPAQLNFSGDNSDEYSSDQYRYNVNTHFSFISKLKIFFQLLYLQYLRNRWNV